MSDSFVTPWTVACQDPLSMGFPRQKYWSGLPFPPPGDLPDPGIKHASPALAGRFFTTKPPGKNFLKVRFTLYCNLGFSGSSVVKNPPANGGDSGLIPGSGRSPGEGNGNSLQYSCLGNPMDRRAWQATVHGVAKESDMT